ncbi:MAG: HesA/MoeB/ThiF family protein [Bacteroidales bacterium]|nr:HesA/MoeB/ThiF family protein [Bacteroidales bacterium]
MQQLTDSEKARFQRNLLLPNFGEEGQVKLRDSKVLVVGAGGLGSPAAFYLTAAGVGHIGIMDYDVVDLSNLQRQILHTTNDIGRQKTQSAHEKLQALNPDAQIRVYPFALTPQNALDIISDYDFVVDATDNLDAKFLINDACVLAAKPFAHGGILAFEGQAMTYVPGHACLRCLYGQKPEKGTYQTTAQVGVLGAIAGNIGTIQATEAVKYLTGVGELLTDKFLRFDGFTLSFFKMNIRHSAHCPVCGDAPTIKSLTDSHP